MPRCSTTSSSRCTSDAFPGHAGRVWPLTRWRSLVRTGARGVFARAWLLASEYVVFSLAPRGSLGDGGFVMVAGGAFTVALGGWVAQVDSGGVGTTVFDRFLATLGRGLTQGAIYALVALGFVLVFKATQTVNFAQGAIALTSAWIFSLVLVNWRIPGRWISHNTYVDWFAAIVVALALAVLLGLVIERIIIRPMIGQPLFSIAVITLGLEAVLRTVSTDAVGVSNRSLGIPWGADSFKIGGATIYWSWIATIAVTALAFIGVYIFFRTRTGIAMRAVAFDQEAALAQGISVGRVFAIAWGASAALAMIAAIAASMSPIGVGTVTAGTSALAFRALPAVILGGLDSVVGALVGGLVIGLSEVFAGNYLARYTGTLGTGYQLVVPYVVMLLVLVARPYGLFGTPEIRRV